MDARVGGAPKQYLERRSGRAVVGATNTPIMIFNCSKHRLYCILSTFTVRSKLSKCKCGLKFMLMFWKLRESKSM